MLTIITILGFIVGFVVVFYFISPFTEDEFDKEIMTDEDENTRYMVDLSKLTWWKKD